MPFLDEKEWKTISPLLDEAMREIKNYREVHGCALHTARNSITSNATMKFEELTGVSGVNYEIIWHHRLADWGPECSACGHLLRTNKTSYCANCGNTEKDA